MEAVKPRYLEIADKLEHDIVSGRLKHGDRLPNTKDLSSLFSVSVPTIQQGLARLVDKGFVRRSPKLGSYVDSSQLSRRYAIVFGWNPVEIESKYYSLLLDRLLERMDADSISADCHIGLIRDKFERRLKTMIANSEEGRYSCAIILSTSSELSVWAQRQSLLPCVLPPVMDVKESARLGMAHLLSLGVERPLFVGMCAENYGTGYKAERSGVEAAFLEAGKVFDPSCMQYWGASQRDGYEKALALCSGGAKFPDGLFIHHDVLTRGALIAFAERGVKAPADFAFVTHSNRGDGFLTSQSLAKVELDPDLVAGATLKFIKDSMPNMAPGFHMPQFCVKPQLILE